MRYFRRPEAVAYLRGDQGNPVGTVRLYQCPGSVLVEAEVSGLPEKGSGFFGLHIHQGDSCEGAGYPKTLGHFNPENLPHPMHAGDLPPLLRQQNGRAYLAVRTDRFRVEQVLGRTVVVHAMADDFRSQPAGDSGEKIACGVIC